MECTSHSRLLIDHNTHNALNLLLLLLISSYDPFASSSFTSVDKPQL